MTQASRRRRWRRARRRSSTPGRMPSSAPSAAAEWCERARATPAATAARTPGVAEPLKKSLGGSDARGHRTSMPDGIEYLLWRHELTGGEVTTLYAVRRPRRSTRARVVYFPDMERLDFWCAAAEVAAALMRGFFLGEPYRPSRGRW